MTESRHDTILKKVIVGAIGTAVSTVVAYYSYRWLHGDINVTCYPESTIIAQQGLTLVDPQEELKLDVRKVFYRNEPYDAVHLFRFSIVNDDWQSLSKGAEFYFYVGGKPVREAQVLDVTWSVGTDTGDLVQFTRIKDTKAPDAGVGLQLESDFPGHTQARVRLVLNASDSVSGSISSANDSKLIKKSRAGERFTVVTQPGQATITMPPWKFVIWCVAAACVYGSMWLCLSIYFGYFSTGAHILDWVLKKLFNWSVIEWSMKRLGRATDSTRSDVVNRPDK